MQEVLNALAHLLKRSSLENLLTLYTVVQESPVLSVADESQDAIKVSFPDRYKYRIAEVGRYMATKADERENTKFGVLLLGISGAESDREALELLATHDEFTLHAALALARLASNPEEVLWDVAKRVYGWGRVQVVEMLRDTRNRDIQAWMLRDGFRNRVMDEYLAGVCAKTGRLHEALRSTEVDRQLLDGAAGIIKALIHGGPADSIDDYPQASEAIHEYLGHVARTADLGLEHLLCIARVNRFVSEEDGWQERLTRVWTQSMREEIRAMCRDLIGRPEWSARVRAGLSSDDNRVFFEADAAAQQLGISTREVHLARLRRDPLKSSSWYRLLQQTDGDQIEDVLRFAEEAIPLERIATGPEGQLGFGKRYKAHRALDWILQNLKRFPKHGWTFLRAGLQSPVTRNRNMALNALMKWPRHEWPTDAEWRLRKVLMAEPNERLRIRLEEALHDNPTAG